MGPNINYFYNGARKWEQTTAIYMMALSSTKVHPDNVSHIGMTYYNVQPTQALKLGTTANCMSL